MRASLPSLAHVADFLDATLRIVEIPDYPNALNGVQVANETGIVRVACAVDFSTGAVEGAIDARANLLIVHHGMFWGGAEPLTGQRHRRLRLLFANDIAVYSAHLPLDVHPELGNNTLLASALGLKPSGGFARFQTIDVGLSGLADIPTRTLADRARAFAEARGGSLISTPFDASRVTRTWGMCTGSGADSSTLREAAGRHIDTLIVGEGPHHTAVEARELGIVILYAGHYATETLGVRALGDAITTKFGIPSVFIDIPTGL